jgi:hypothetical protein
MPEIKDQYLKAHDLFDSENSRFWTRFNLFTGLQLVMIAGFAANYSELVDAKSLGVLFSLTALAFSVFTVLVMWRSYQINMGVFRAIVELEQMDETLLLLKTYGKHSKSPMGAIARYCVVMSAVLGLFWVILTFKVMFS